ncbi:hypothetical protein KRX51_01485 [Corynebacterium sp. TAE3-ERU12]|uniref:hypothetical protein n=1 Tax=Corynebacterium sp. TAE3-ERU12 TaxID=2849491 RepID=UPI001C463D5D|nr:hypothetical protein [Corynebacterium sp. TAE3-ERU12]MBV7294588.1 hypothetical protein [Corynebacterium sp. TAE3-ERU12]
MPSPHQPQRPAESGAELSRMPQYLIDKVAALGATSTEAIRRTLPPRYQHLAPALAQRLGIGEPAATPEHEPTPTPTPTPEEGPVPVPAPAASARNKVAEALADFVSAASSAPAVDPDDVLTVDPSLFADYDHSATVSAAAELALTTYRSGGAEQVVLRWDTPDWVDHDYVIYRVIAGDGEQELSPEAGEQVLCTTGHIYVEPQVSGVSFRHFQVWVHQGPDIAAALGAQPQLVGYAIAVAPVRAITLAASQGVVEGSWAPMPPDWSVRVHASPAGSAQPADAPEFLLGSGVQETSFAHRPPTRGGTWRYVFTPVVRLSGGWHLGEPSTVHRADIPAVTRPVSLDFYDVEQHGGDDRIVLSWCAPPAGSVSVYLTQRHPHEDLSQGPISADALARDEVFAAAGTTKVTVGPREEGAPVDADTIWPVDADTAEAWSVVYITPVTEVGEMVAVGPTVALHQVQPISAARIAERIDTQVVSFAWPRGADFVSIDITDLGAGTGGQRRRVADLEPDDYKNNSGVRLGLNPYGNDVILTPYVMYQGRTTSAEPTVLSYPGLRRYRWRMLTDPTALRIQVWTDSSADVNPPRLQLVHHPDRLPLCIADAADDGAGVCTVIPVDPDTGQPSGPAGTVLAPDTLPGVTSGAGGQSAAATWLVPASALSGMRPGQFFRLFLVADDEPGATTRRRVLVDNDAAAGIYQPPSRWGKRR